MEDPQLKARNMLVPTKDEGIKNMIFPGNPMKFQQYDDPTTRETAPFLDGHRDEVMRFIAEKFAEKGRTPSSKL